MEVNNGKPGPTAVEARQGASPGCTETSTLPWGTHRETGEWVHVKAMEVDEGGERRF